MAELKPCPFCGRIPIVDDCGKHGYFVRCKCGIAQDKLYMQKCNAVKRWNTRKTGKIDTDIDVSSKEIIRCKDCKFAYMTVNGECKYCDIWFPDEKTYMPGDYYCASAERRGEAECVTQ